MKCSSRPVILDSSEVIYESRDGKEEKVFDALEWLAAMTSHVPNKGEQMVRYYGHYSNASRGLRQGSCSGVTSSYVIISFLDVLGLKS